MAAPKPSPLPGGAKSDGVTSPLDPSIYERLKTGVRFILTGQRPDTFFGPSQPLEPQAQNQAQGRAFDYPVAYNTRWTPRSEESISFSQLRALADGLDILRLGIETRKDQLAKQIWTVRPKDLTKKTDPRCQPIIDFLQYPDREHDFATWMRLLAEDMFVIDAATIYPRMTRGGGVYSLDVIDGSTIKRVLNNDGRTPVPPDPAYQQILKGLPAVDYSRDELIYVPRNPRPSKVYGMSPVEQIVMTINIAIRRSLGQLAFYTSGSTPDLIFSVPDTWNPDQVKQFKDWWESTLAGNLENRRGTMFVPSGVKPFDTKDRQLKDDFDEWLTRIVCFALSLPATAFSKQVNRATAGTTQDVGLEEGLAPTMNWAKSFMDRLLSRWFGFSDLEFAWVTAKEVDQAVQATIDQIYLAAKVVTPDEVRQSLGMDPLTPEQKAELTPPPPPELAGADGPNPNPGERKPDAKDPPPVGGKAEKKKQRNRWIGTVTRSHTHAPD